MMPEFLDIVLVMAERDQIQVAFRRFAANEAVEAIFREHLIDRAQPIGAFGMSGGVTWSRHGRMSQKKRRHADSWRSPRLRKRII